MKRERERKRERKKERKKETVSVRDKCYETEIKHRVLTR